MRRGLSGFSEKSFWLYFALIYVGVFLIPNLFVLPEGDEVLYLLQGHWLSRGILPYRDFFQFVYPGVLFLGGAVDTVLGGLSVMANRLAILLIQGVALWMLFQMAKPLMNAAVARWLLVFVLVCVLGNYSIFSHHALSGATVIFSVYALWQSLQFDKNAICHPLMLLSGVFCAACLLTTQSLGLLLACWLLTYLLLSGVKKTVLLPFITGLILPLLITFQWLQQTGAWPEFIAQTYQWVMSGHYSKTTLWGYFTTGLVELVRVGFTQTATSKHQLLLLGLPKMTEMLLNAVLPLLGVVWGIRACWRQYRKSALNFTGPLFVLTGTALVMMASTLTYSTSYHIAMNSWPALLLAMLALRGGYRRFNALTQRTMKGIAVLFFVTMFLWKIQYAGLLFLSPECWLPSHGTLERSFYKLSGADDTKAYTLVSENLHHFSRPDEGIFIYSASPQFYLLAGRNDSTHYTIVYPVYLSELQLSDMMQSLQKNPPPMMLDDRKAGLMLTRDPRFEAVRQEAAATGKPLKALPELDAFADRYYQRVLVRQDLQLLMRNDLFARVNAKK